MARPGGQHAIAQPRKTDDGVGLDQHKPGAHDSEHQKVKPWCLYSATTGCAELVRGLVCDHQELKSQVWWPQKTARPDRQAANAFAEGGTVQQIHLSFLRFYNLRMLHNSMAHGNLSQLHKNANVRINPYMHKLFLLLCMPAKGHGICRTWYNSKFIRPLYLNLGPETARMCDQPTPAPT